MTEGRGQAVKRGGEELSAGGSGQASTAAIGLILLAMLSFTLQDVTVKLVAADTSLWQIQMIRSAAVIGLLCITVTLMRRRKELIPTRWRWPLVRSFVLSGAYLCFYASLPFLTLAQAGAAFFTGPLIITVLAAVLLREPIGPRRIVAVVVGFVGVVLIVQPGEAGWSPIALLPLAAAFFYAMGMVLTRWRCRDQPGFALTFTHNCVYAAIGFLGVLLLPILPVGEAARTDWPFLLTGWVAIGTASLALLLLTAATHMVGMLCSVAAYHRAEASKIAPFEYSYLVMMPVMDLLIWNVLPSLSVALGMLLIIGAGSFVAWREGRPARPRVQFRNEVAPRRDESD